MFKDVCLCGGWGTTICGQLCTGWQGPTIQEGGTSSLSSRDLGGIPHGVSHDTVGVVPIRGSLVEVPTSQPDGDLRCAIVSKARINCQRCSLWRNYETGGRYNSDGGDRQILMTGAGGTQRLHITNGSGKYEEPPCSP